MILKALRAATASEALAIEFLEVQRRTAEREYRHYSGTEVYEVVSGNGRHNSDFRLRCRNCLKIFTVRTRAIFE
jgi:hypothetical protein